MTRPTRLFVAAGAAGLALAAGLVVPVVAHAATGPVVYTDEQLATMDPVAQAAILDPLRAIANAVGAVGRGPAADIYGNLMIDANHGLVQLYLTDPAQLGRVVTAARQVDPAIDTSRIRVARAAWTHQQLNAAADRVVDLAAANRLPYSVDLVGPAPDASGLDVDGDGTTAAPMMTRAEADAEVGVPVRLLPGHALGAKTAEDTTSAGTASAAAGSAAGSRAVAAATPWQNVKWSDSAPFIGGDAIVRGGPNGGKGRGCTAGLPAVRKSNNKRVMVTAAHCFGSGTEVYTRGGTPGAYNNGETGHWVGTVQERYQWFDSELIEGADNNADVSLSSGYRALDSVAYSYNGDYVCHAGQASFFEGHPTPCSIKVNHQDVVCGPHGVGPNKGCPGLPAKARGVWGDGMDVDHWGAADGDSGATIFVERTGGRDYQARGVLSDGDKGDGAPGVFWVEAPDIFNHFGLTLNTVT